MNTDGMPKYMQLARELENGIRGGKYAPGKRLPSENELTRLYGISRQTVRQALAQLEKLDLIEKRQGSGTTVRQPRPLRQRTGNIGVITTYIGEYIFPEMLGGIEEEFQAAGFSPIISATRNRLDMERAILTDYLQKPIDGLIVEGTKTALPNPNIELYQQLGERGVPIVFVHGFYPELRHLPHVVADDATGGYDAVRHLQGHGHVNIAGIFKSDDIQGHRRYGGYIRALQQNGLPVVDDRVLWYTTENRRRTIDNFVLETLAGCSAVVCYNDEVAVQLLEKLRGGGLRVPQDISIISFDNSTYSDLTPVKISSFNVGEANLGRQAARRLLAMVEGRAEGPLVLPWALAEKESVHDRLHTTR